MSKQSPEKRTHRLLSHELWSTDNTDILFVEEIHAYSQATADQFFLSNFNMPIFILQPRKFEAFSFNLTIFRRTQ